MVDANWLDRTIIFLSPEKGNRRLKQRALSNILVKKRGYEGAAHGHRVDGWRTVSQGSVNTENMTSLATLRNRSRDLVRNNPYASRGIGVIASNTIGEGIIAQIRGKNKAKTADLIAAWNKWSETNACDADGKHNFRAIQTLLMRCMPESGEVLIRRRWRHLSDNLPVPLQIQILEPDFIDTARNELLDGGNYIIQGIEFNSLGQRVAYYLFNEHPGGWVTGKFTLNSTRIDAKDILHVFRGDRPGQIRGIPWLASAILRLRDFDEYEDAQLIRQKIAACFAVFVTDNDPGTETTKAAISDRVTPGLIEVLPAGKDIKFGNPPAPDGYADFSRVTLHGVSAALGVTYEAMTTDLSTVNFSSARMGWLEFHRNINQWQWQIMVPQAIEPIFQWFLEAAYIAGFSTDGASAEWTPPIREQIDPVKETFAANAAIRSGQTTLKETIRSRGYDPDKVFKERQEELAELDKLGIVTDSDPRKINIAGTEQPSDGASKNQGDE